MNFLCYGLSMANILKGSCILANTGTKLGVAGHPEASAYWISERSKGTRGVKRASEHREQPRATSGLSRATPDHLGLPQPEESQNDE